MQPGANPEDIHTILSRFSHWAGEQPANGNGHRKGLKSLGAGVREIPYEEAMRLMRSRKPGSPPSVAAAQPAANTVEKAVPAGEQIRATVIKTEDRSSETSRKRVSGKKQAAKETPEPKTAKPEKRTLTSAHEQCKAGHVTPAAQPPQFRQVLAKSVREGKATKKSVPARSKGRDQHVSVRLSRAEEIRLQACAAKAGVTVSEYLRMCALKTDSGATRSTATITVATHPGKTVVEPPAESPKRAGSGLGEWIALLRNRFLASPARFAEKA
jgi:hypothetical protein